MTFTSQSTATTRPQIASAQDHLARLRPAKLVLNPSGDVGAALKEARESLGLEVEDIASATRVRAAHIAALEAFEIDRLPARPFAIGYARAYARALGVDAEAVVARFRAEAPSKDTTLRAPLVLSFGDRKRYGWFALAISMIVGCVVAWNVLVHFKGRSAAPVGVIAPTAPLARRPTGPVELGAPLPAPPEATTPPAYETPGLDAAQPGQASPKADAGAVAQPDPDPVGAAFVAQGSIYGVGQGGSGVVLQARRPTSLVVRGGGGVVYFARQLAAGEAWRAPAMAGLTADVGNPASVEVFVSGLSRGALTEAHTPLAKLQEAS